MIIDKGLATMNEVAYVSTSSSGDRRTRGLPSQQGPAWCCCSERTTLSVPGTHCPAATPAGGALGLSTAARPCGARVGPNGGLRAGGAIPARWRAARSGTPARDGHDREHLGQHTEDGSVRVIQDRLWHLALQHQKLMTQSENLRIATVAAGQQQTNTTQHKANHEHGPKHERHGPKHERRPYRRSAT